METESVYCNGCHIVTTWTAVGWRWRCQSCRTMFPCTRDCLHFDCGEEKTLTTPPQIDKVEG